MLFKFPDPPLKFINESKKTSQDKYGISQADLYQMFSYGQKYLEGCGKIVLIYPMHSKLNAHLPVFNFSEELKLYVLPFDLKNGSLAEQYLVEELL
ncbi:5-methylcytosine restriction system specificity protein McrC [Acinetobacter sp.]|uniref:5-methylcytosine restriction system specificity protein McrC n=1 Tax=Acinetobacter sp. TaxID=472 RepID=UPI003B00D9F9